jgi:hypothetical protein
MKKRSHKRRQRGGGWGFVGPSSIPGTPGTVNNAQVFTGIGDCRAVRPGYDIPYSSYSASMKGLPGMSGGAKTRKGQKGKKTRKQRGGRYGFFPESIGTVTPNGAAWWAGTYPPVQRIGCEGGSFNPLNPTHTGSSAPPGAANPNYYLKGGAQQMAPATYGVGNVDSMYYYAPTGGYANTASTWKDSVGAPVQIQVPYAARAMNQACLTTGGAPPLTGALQKGGKRTRKQRGGLPSLQSLAQSIGLAGAFNTVSQQAQNLARRYGPAGFGGTGVNGAAVAAEAGAEGYKQPIMPRLEGNNNNAAPVVAPAQPVVPAPAMPAVQAPGMNPAGNSTTGNTRVGEAGPEGGRVVMGGRKRRHRKHKKMTHKRRH